MKSYQKIGQKIGKKILMIVGSFCCSVLAIILLTSILPEKVAEVREFEQYVSATSSKIPADKVKINEYMHDVKCKDTVWGNDIYVDSSYSIWLNPNTHIYHEYVEYEPIKIIKHEDSTFTVDLTKCKDDYEWIMYDKVDFKLQEYYPVKQIIYKERLKK